MAGGEEKGDGKGEDHRAECVLSMLHNKGENISLSCNVRTFLRSGDALAGQRSG